MAVRDHDGNVQTGRREDNLSTIGIIAAALIIGLVLLFMMVPRTDAPTSATTNPNKVPVTTTTPSTPTTPK